MTQLQYTCMLNVSIHLLSPGYPCPEPKAFLYCTKMRINFVFMMHVAIGGFRTMKAYRTVGVAICELQNDEYTYSIACVVDENMFQVVVDLFIAGSETTSTTLRWGLLYMILNPAVQTKCRQEILQVGANMENITQ